jgi:hypothetical protein
LPVQLAKSVQHSAQQHLPQAGTGTQFLFGMLYIARQCDEILQIQDRLIQSYRFWWLKEIIDKKNMQTNIQFDLVATVTSDVGIPLVTIQIMHDYYPLHIGVLGNTGITFLIAWQMLAVKLCIFHLNDIFRAFI